MKDPRAALNRVTFGVTDTELQAVEKQGWAAWIKAQLQPGEDPKCDARLNGLTYTVEVGRMEREANATFGRYFETPAQLVARIPERREAKEVDFNRPAVEAAIATWTRAIHSRKQVRELLVEFWHNHFNVSIEAEDEIAMMMAVYDREVIRKHALGNFRQFLEAVATSPAMLYYLDNAYSKASPANENYARELFELHTLGAENYFNHLYDDWRQVPGAMEGRAEGYIDEDVYEAARAFTGWTVADGREVGESALPFTGEFHYYDRWHDHYQKRVLGVEFRSHREAMADGRQVLDLVAYHPATARHVCTKLCRWWVGDHPPESVIDKAVATWTEHARADDQIARTVETILLSPEFAAGLGQKVKRPNHLLLALVRQTGLDITPSMEWYWLLEQMGYRQFSWPVPTGHPDEAGYWLSTDRLLKRWNSVPLVLYHYLEEGN
ncbi:MAG: DUF1800 domain-containing protein [Bacteroidota bacterium]